MFGERSTPFGYETKRLLSGRTSHRTETFCRSQETLAHETGMARSFTSALESVGLGYSVLSAVMGEIEAARRAGMIAAKNAEMASADAATASARGSQMGTR